MPMQSYGNSARHLRRRTCETVCIMRRVSRLWSPCAASVGESCSVARACTPTMCPCVRHDVRPLTPRLAHVRATCMPKRAHPCPLACPHLPMCVQAHPRTYERMLSRAHVCPCLRVGVCGCELRVCVGLRGCTRLRMDVYVCALVRASRNTKKTHAPSSVRRLCLSCGRYVPVLCLASSASCEADSCQTSCALCVPVLSQSEPCAPFLRAASCWHTHEAKPAHDVAHEATCRTDASVVRLRVGGLL